MGEGVEGWGSGCVVELILRFVFLCVVWRGSGSGFRLGFRRGIGGGC